MGCSCSVSEDMRTPKHSCSCFQTCKGCCHVLLMSLPMCCRQSQLWPLITGGQLLAADGACLWDMRTLQHLNYHCLLLLRQVVSSQGACHPAADSHSCGFCAARHGADLRWRRYSDLLAADGAFPLGMHIVTLLRHSFCDPSRMLS